MKCFHEVRQELDLTLRQCAKLAGMMPSELSDYENGRRIPGEKAITALAAIIGKDYDATCAHLFQSRVKQGKPSDPNSIVIACGPKGCKVMREGDIRKSTPAPATGKEKP